LVGPNPYRLHSFRELRKVMGRPYIVCRPCLRYVSLGTWLDDRDTGATTFSCSVCGSQGEVVFEDPEKEDLQHDPRPTLARHQLAALRLQMFRRLADPFGHRAAAREALPQRHKPYREPWPRFGLVPLPIRTFRGAFDFGLGLRIHCPGCHDWRPVELTAEQRELPFAGGVRFVCRHEKLKVYGEGREVCGSIGEPLFTPTASRDPEREVVDIQCYGGTRRHPHPGWEISGVDLRAAPWAGLLDTGGERFSCPGCGSVARHTFHSPHPPSRPAAAPTF
jgi:hypothetical protein